MKKAPQFSPQNQRSTKRQSEEAVLALVNVRVKARDMAEVLKGAGRELLLILDRELTVTSASTFDQRFKMTSREILNTPVCERDESQWDIAPLRQQLEEVLLKHRGFEDFRDGNNFPWAGGKSRFVDHDFGQSIRLTIKETV